MGPVYTGCEGKPDPQERGQVSDTSHSEKNSEVSSQKIRQSQENRQKIKINKNLQKISRQTKSRHQNNPKEGTSSDKKVRNSWKKS